VPGDGHYSKRFSPLSGKVIGKAYKVPRLVVRVRTGARLQRHPGT
jgi:hypothetical protein